VESNARAPVLEINGKEKKELSEEVSFQLVLALLKSVTVR